MLVEIGEDDREEGGGRGGAKRESGTGRDCGERDRRRGL